MHIHPDPAHNPSFPRGGAGARRDTRQRRIRALSTPGASRRGGHEQRRARSSSVRSACPTASPNSKPLTPEPHRPGGTGRHFHPRTTAPPIGQRSTRSPAAPSRSATSAPAPTDPRPTAKPNDSSAPSSAAGPTARSTAQAPNAMLPSPAGLAGTTPDDPTAPSATSHPSLASTN